MPNTISSSAYISKLADIETSVKGSSIVIGENSYVDSFVKMKFAGGPGDIMIGDQCYINSGTVLYSRHGIKLSNKVLIAANCTLAPVNHGIKKNKSMLEQPHMSSKDGIVIEDDVWVGCNSIILKGVTIGHSSIVAAGSVVTTSVEPFSIVAGNPAKVVKTISPSETKR